MYLTFNPLDVMTFFHRETDHSPMDFGFPIFRQSQFQHRFFFPRALSVDYPSRKGINVCSQSQNTQGQKL